jgi:acyl-CoA thioester hydrolase
LKFHETEIRVRFYEADSWEMAWHGHYVGWFEAGRIALAKRFDLMPAQFTELGLFAPVISLKVDYKAMGKFDDLLVIRTAVKVPTKAALEFVYEAVRKEDGKLLAMGETTQVLVNKKGELTYIIPEPLKTRVDEMVKFCNGEI